MLVYIIWLDLLLPGSSKKQNKVTCSHIYTFLQVISRRDLSLRLSWRPLLPLFRVACPLFWFVCCFLVATPPCYCNYNIIQTTAIAPALGFASTGFKAATSGALPASTDPWLFIVVHKSERRSCQYCASHFLLYQSVLIARNCKELLIGAIDTQQSVVIFRAKLVLLASKQHLLLTLSILHQVVLRVDCL